MRNFASGISGRQSNKEVVYPFKASAERRRIKSKILCPEKFHAETGNIFDVCFANIFWEWSKFHYEPNLHETESPRHIYPKSQKLFEYWWLSSQTNWFSRGSRKISQLKARIVSTHKNAENFTSSKRFLSSVKFCKIFDSQFSQASQAWLRRLKCI